VCHNPCRKGVKGTEKSAEGNILETVGMLFEDGLGITPNHTSKLIQSREVFILSCHCTRERVCVWLACTSWV
jgi:hypothetical protein